MNGQATPVPTDARDAASVRHVRRARVALCYRWRHGHWPALDRPRLFTEWVQWRKLHDRCHQLARLTDKLEAKALVAETLGSEFVIPTVWSGEQLPDSPPAALPLMVKANHGCGQFMAVRSLDEWRAARHASADWMKRGYGRWLDEWHYQAARRLLLVEPLIGDPATLPIDYKIYVFHGRAAMVQVHEDRTGEHRWAQLDLDWSPLSAQRTNLPPPFSLAAMVAAAERLAGDRHFLRVDFYEHEGRAVFGEFCLYPGSGLDPFRPSSLDAWLGSRWGEMVAEEPPTRSSASARIVALCRNMVDALGLEPRTR